MCRRCTCDRCWTTCAPAFSGCDRAPARRGNATHGGLDYSPLQEASAANADAKRKFLSPDMLACIEAVR